MNESQRTVLQEAIDTYGKDNQLWMVIEEMSELAKEICKNKRGQDNEAKIADEIADVTIMLEQAKMIFGNADLVEKWIQFKVDRLKYRISLAKTEKETMTPEERIRRQLTIRLEDFMNVLEYYTDEGDYKDEEAGSQSEDL